MSGSAIFPYLFFNGKCHEALEYYRSALGAEIEMVMTFKESPEPPPPGVLPPGFEDKVMHASVQIAGARFMASDGCGEKSQFEGFRLALTTPTEAEAHRYFNGLADGGEVQMPLTKTFWSPCYGMVTDRFGVGWMVMVPAPSSADGR